MSLSDKIVICIQIMVTRMQNLIRKNVHIGALCRLNGSTISTSKKSHITFGRNCVAKHGCRFLARENSLIKISDDTSFNYGCIITSRESIEIGKRCAFGPHVMVFDHDHDYKNHPKDFNSNYKTNPIIIGDNCWIGANVLILRGTILGDRCVVGANTVLKGNYPSDSIIIQERQTKVLPIERKDTVTDSIDYKKGCM